jgi:GntR family transcriptional regulator
MTKALHQSPVPLYYQISDDLEAKIRSGEYGPGARLPSEKEIAKEYEVSPITVRGAMRLLIEKRLVVRYRGKGTFVIEHDTDHVIWGLGTLDDLVYTGSISRMTLLSRRLVTPPPWARERLALPSGAKAFALTTKREADGEAFLFTKIFMAQEIGEKLTKADFQSEAARSKVVVTLVEEKCDIKVRNIRQTMSAESADEEIAKVLGLEVGQPLLRVERDYFDEDGWMFQTDRSFYRADHYSYTINLTRVDRAH